MKKKVFGGITALAIVAVAVFNMSLGSKSSNLSGISLANVEALAQEVLPEVEITCGRSNGACWQDDGCEVKPTPFGPFRVTQCKFSGYMRNSCYSGLPC